MTLRISVVQTDPKLGATAGNLDTMVAAVESADAELVVFPECALSGYGFASKDEAWPFAELVPGPATERLVDASKRTGRWSIAGMLERDGDDLFNAAVLMGPDGVAGVYRKNHLPFLGVDRFVTQGNHGFPVFDTPLGKIGILICFDLSFPEAARCLKLGGAQVICVPTNWPMAAAVSCEHAPPVRAQENHVWIVTADRVGEESGFAFRGRSRICDPDGHVIVQAGDGLEVITADVDPAVANENRTVIVPGEYELDRMGQRRPEYYAAISDPDERISS
ncbi:MAG: hypothetical protein CMJ83_07915 [Planctomycetes bacterium]|jgi:predicted amidohydrolase|nr:hypothetical protein [Planctomycetota bacterium]